MKIIREHIFEEEEFRWIKGPTIEQVKARLLHKKFLSLEDKFDFALENNAVWLVKQCVDEGYDPSFQDNFALRWASRHNYLEIVKELLKDKRVRDELNYEMKIKHKELLKQYK